MTDCSQQFLFPPDDEGSQERLNELVSPSTRFTSTTSSYQSQNALLEDKAILLDQYDKLDKQEALENKKQNRELRKDFAYKAYEIAWMSFILDCNRLSQCNCEFCYWACIFIRYSPWDCYNWSNCKCFCCFIDCY